METGGTDDALDEYVGKDKCYKLKLSLHACKVFSVTQESN